MAPSALQRPIRLNQHRDAIFINAANLYYLLRELGTLIKHRAREKRKNKIPVYFMKPRMVTAS